MSPSGQKQQQGPFLQPSTMASTEGPFTEQITQALQPAQDNPLPLQPSGWGSKASGIAFLASNFLGGVQKGRVANFMRSENEKQKKMAQMDQHVQELLSNPDLTEKAREAILQEYSRVKGYEVQQNADTGTKGGEKGGTKHAIATLFKELGIGLAGGPMPKGAKDIGDPHAIMGKLDAIALDPQNRVSKSLESIAGQADASLKQWKEAQEKSGGPAFAEGAMGVMSPFMRQMELVKPGSSRLLEPSLAPFQSAPKPGSPEETMYYLNRGTPPPGSGGAQRTPTPPGAAPASAAPAGVDPLTGLAGATPPPPSSAAHSGPPPVADTPAFSPPSWAINAGGMSGMIGKPTDVTYTDPQTGKPTTVLARWGDLGAFGSGWLGPDNKPITAKDVQQARPPTTPRATTYRYGKETLPGGKARDYRMANEPGAKKEYLGEAYAPPPRPAAQMSPLQVTQKKKIDQEMLITAGRIKAADQKMGDVQAINAVLEGIPEGQDLETVIAGDPKTDRKSWHFWFKDNPKVKGHEQAVSAFLENLAQKHRSSRKDATDWHSLGAKLNEKAQSQAEAEKRDAGQTQQSLQGRAEAITNAQEVANQMVDSVVNADSMVDALMNADQGAPPMSVQGPPE